MHQRVRHEREDTHSSMLNITTRIAVEIQNLPDWPVDWSDEAPQRSRSSLTIEDFTPTEEDTQILQKRAVHYMMRFLVNEFSDLADMKRFAPPEQLHSVKATKVVPMLVLFKDEKFVAQTVDILSQLTEDAKLTGDPQVVVGDQLTCKNIRGSKMWLQPEIDPKNRMKWACQSPGDFHFLWECLRVAYTLLWGSPAQPGSLCNLCEMFRRTQVDKSVKVFNVGDEFLVHTFKSHLNAAIMSELKIGNVTDHIEHQQSRKWLQDTAEKLASQTLTRIHHSDDPICLFASPNISSHYLLYIDLREAIRWENGPQVIRHWKVWLPRFLVTGCRNYASESVHLLSNLAAEFPKHIAYITTHNRTVNMKGKPGHGKPVDQLMEHYNLVFKQTLRSAGGNLTVKHVEEVSMSVLFLLEAARKADQIFSVPPTTTSHTVRGADKDH